MNSYFELRIKRSNHPLSLTKKKSLHNSGCQTPIDPLEYLIPASKFLEVFSLLRER